MKMKTYKVAVTVVEVQVWLVKAKDAVFAELNYDEGDHVYTKPKTDDVEWVEEVK